MHTGSTNHLREQACVWKTTAATENNQQRVKSNRGVAANTHASHYQRLQKQLNTIALWIN
jgi:hypothetical protein